MEQNNLNISNVMHSSQLNQRQTQNPRQLDYSNPQLQPSTIYNHGNNDIQHSLVSTNMLLDQRGDNLLTSFLSNQQPQDLAVSADSSFLLGNESFNTGQLLMETSPANKFNYEGPKEISYNASIKEQQQVTTINTGSSSPVKRDMTKVKQSPFKKRGNFEEETTMAMYPKSDSKDYSHSDLQRQLMSKMFGLLKEGVLCDSVILSGNSEIRIHKLVLLAACPFILSKMANLSHNASLKIELPRGIPLNVTSQLVHYLYDGKLTLTSDNVADFARVANLFKLTHLLDMCKDFTIMFGVNPSILHDRKEDIRVIAKTDPPSVMKEDQTTQTYGILLVEVESPSEKDSPSKAPPPPKSKPVNVFPMIAKSPESNRKQKGDGKTTKKSNDSPPKTSTIAPTTPSHSYGTRRASMKANIEANSASLLNNSHSSDSFSPFKSKHPIHTNEAFINSNKPQNFIVNKNHPLKISPSKSADNGIAKSHDMSGDKGIFKSCDNVRSKLSDNGTDYPSPTKSLPNTSIFSTNKELASNKQDFHNFSSKSVVKGIPPDTSNIIEMAEEPYNENEMENMSDEDATLDDAGDENFDNISELTDDCDLDVDWKPNTKVKPRAFTKKGRAAKAFKKSYAAFLKTSKPKKSTDEPEQKEIQPSRPPPKKRAKEFTHTEFEELEDILSKPQEKGIVHTFPQENVEMKTEFIQESKPAKKFKKNLKKIATYRASQLSAVAAQIEQRAEYLPANERHFVCDICGNHYIFSKRAVTHIIAIHDIDLEDITGVLSIRKKEKVLKMCDICGYETKEPNFFYIHFHRYFRHGVPLPKGMEPFKCDICGKECFTKFQLKDHKLIHEEGTPFICETCGQGFNSRTCLTSHVFHKHSKVRNHKCTDYGCQKAFKTRTQLLVHMRSHTGEKPFTCPDCNYHSTTRGNMRLHLKNKHKHKPEIVKNIMTNLKPSTGDELHIDLPTNHIGGGTQVQIQVCGQKKPKSKAKNILKAYYTVHDDFTMEPKNIRKLHTQMTQRKTNSVSNETQTVYDLETNLNDLESGQDSNILYDPSVNFNVTTQQALLLKNFQNNQIEMVNDQDLQPVQNNQLLVTSDQMLTQDQNTAANQLNDSKFSMQDTKFFLQQSEQESSMQRQNGFQHQRFSDNSKQLPLVDVQDLQPVYIHDQQNNMLASFEPNSYPDEEEEQVILRNNPDILHKGQGQTQGPVMLTFDSNQSHLPKIHLAFQDRDQLEPTVQGLIASSSQNIPHSHDNDQQLQTTNAKSTQQRLYLVDVHTISANDVDTVTGSIDQNQLGPAEQTNDNAASLSQQYNDPQLLYHLYQQYNQNYH